ncbi:MAG: hypothetical protein ACQEQY_07280, partial [Halobacteriota archaeon]
MATTGRPAATDPDVSALTATLREADFVHFVSHADGDSVAAAGILANALEPATPYQVSTVRTGAAADRRIESSTETTVSIGIGGEDADSVLFAESNAIAAFDVASDFGDPDAILAIAGALAAGTVPHGEALDAATESGVQRRPGVGIPTADLGDGLAHSTLFHADVSGDEQRAGALLAELDLPAAMDEAAHRRLASAVALAATEPPAPDHAVTAIEAVLRPYVLTEAPFETVEGYADVLDVLVRTEPGLATALALDHADRTDVLEAWREHASAVHDAVRLGDRTRHSGFVVLETAGADPWTTARLVRDFRSAEPTVLVVAADEVALAT